MPKPITEAAPIGHFEPARDPAILLQLQADKKLPERKQWARLVRSNDQATSQVLSNSRLVSLPGYRSNIQLDSGVQLTLWGNVPEILPFPVTLESVATLHMDPQFDLDLTLLRGRIALKIGKAQANVRLRFHNPADVTKGESWKITLLEKGTEVIVNLAGIMLPGEPFYPDKENPRRTGPIAVALLLVHTGSATVGPESQPGEKLVPPPAGPLLLWDSRGGQKSLKLDAMPPWVQPLPPIPKEGDTKALTVARESILAAMESLNADLTGRRSIRDLLLPRRPAISKSDGSSSAAPPRWTIYSA